MTLAGSSHWRDAAAVHLNWLLICHTIAYFVLDIYPYATYFSTPFDPADDPATWIRFGLLVLSAVVIPLITPRPFRPQTPNAKPSAEDTAPPLSAYTFSFLDQIVFRANRVGDVKPEDMPELPEREKIELLADKAFKVLDPTKVGKRNIVWGLIRAWRA